MSMKAEDEQLRHLEARWKALNAEYGHEMKSENEIKSGNVG